MRSDRASDTYVAVPRNGASTAFRRQLRAIDRGTAPFIPTGGPSSKPAISTRRSRSFMVITNLPDVATRVTPRGLSGTAAPKYLRIPVFEPMNDKVIDVHRASDVVHL